MPTDVTKSTFAMTMKFSMDYLSSQRNHNTIDHIPLKALVLLLPLDKFLTQMFSCNGNILLKF